MTRAALPLLSALVLISFGLAGCVGDEIPTVETPKAPEGVDPSLVKDGRDLRTELLPSDTLAVPTWPVGAHFGHHVFFGAEDTAGAHFTTIVVESSANAYLMATDDQEVAKEQAVYNFPILGEFSKTDLSTQAFGSEWSLYKFPITDNATWSKTLKLSREVYDTETTFNLNLKASYNGAIQVGNKKLPGFDIEASDANGNVLIRSDYVPAIGWYAHFTLYDLKTEDTSDFIFHSMNMGYGFNWTGTYYVDSARLVVNHQHFTGINPGNPPTTLPAPYTEANPHATFTIGNTAQYILGYYVVVSWAGTTHIYLFDPENNRDDYSATGTNVMGAPDHTFDFINRAAKPGEWRVAIAPAAGVSFALLVLWEITETQAKLA
jgi:hypothetical protein